MRKKGGIQRCPYGKGVLRTVLLQRGPEGLGLSITVSFLEYPEGPPQRVLLHLNNKIYNEIVKLLVQISLE